VGSGQSPAEAERLGAKQKRQSTPLGAFHLTVVGFHVEASWCFEILNRWSETARPEAVAHSMSKKTVEEP
jgi:hypothetical protein